MGNEGWDWDTLAPYYRKFQTLALPESSLHENLCVRYLETEKQGTSGPIQASFTELNEPITKAWLDTFEALGRKVTGDPLSGLSTGAFSNPCSIESKTKERSFSGNAYYAPIANRPNLHILTKASVEKILLERDPGKETVTATGVQYSVGGKKQVAKARKEVIVSASTCHSPKILELSGIGDASLLKTYDIESYIDDPFVGENFQDHLMTGISYEVNEDVPTMESMRDPKFAQAAMEAYVANRTGHLSSSTLNSFAFMPVVETKGEEGCLGLKELLSHHLDGDTPPKFPAERAQYQLIRESIKDPHESSAAIYDRGPALKDIFAMSLPGNYVSFGVSNSHPFSRGSVHISSADPADKSTLDPRYFSRPLDVEIFARHVRYLETIAATASLASYLKPNGRRNDPEAFLAGKSLDAVKDYTRKTVMSTWHATGTCAMMPREVGSVVNSRLVVHGTGNVRVVDASIMPLEPRGNIQTSVYAIAERAADLIKQDYGMMP